MKPLRWLPTAFFALTRRVVDGLNLTQRKAPGQPLSVSYHRSTMTTDELDPRSLRVDDYRTAVEQVVHWYEQLTPQRWGSSTVYASTARFADPFNDVRGWWRAIRPCSSTCLRAWTRRVFVVQRRLVDARTPCWCGTFSSFRPEAQELASMAPPFCSLIDGASCCTATTGTPPRNCENCPCWAV